jgi:hypothetical protein
MDPASFVRHQLPLLDRLLGARQQVGLMAQGLQRALDSGGKVLQLKEPSQQLKVRVRPPRTEEGLWGRAFGGWAS